MSAPNVSFAGEIRRVAGSLGLVPTAVQVADLEAELQRIAIVDPEAGTVAIDPGDGKVSAADYIARRRSSLAPAADTAAPAGWVTIRATGGASVRRADDPMARLLNGFQEREAAKTAREVAKWPNPWRSGSENRTRQAVIKNTNPALAEKFMKEAGL